VTDLVAAPDRTLPGTPDDSAAGAEPSARRNAPLAEIMRWSVLGLLVLLTLVLIDVHRFGGNNPVSMVQPGTRGAATALFAQDFPAIEQPDSKGLDGQQYYAIARDPFHLTETGAHLDHPRYRLQRPLLSWAAWALHPNGGGLGLVYALIAVTTLGILAGAIATGYLSWCLRGPVWLAALFPILPGSWWALRVTVSDAMALGLALGAIALASRSRYRWAVVVGILAVLAKEPVILVLGGWWLAHRDRRNLMVVAIPALAAAAWMGYLHLALPPDLPRSQDIALPFTGLVGAWQQVWSGGGEYVGMACTLGGFAIGIAALAFRRLRHPLGWAIAVQLGFMLCMGVNPTAMNFGGTRMAMPVTILSAVALATPDAHRSTAGVDEVPERAIA
jgi:hypothetical protein